MKKPLSLPLLLLIVAFLCRLATADAPHPGPEQKQLEKWVGDWSYEGTSSASPLGPAGKFSGNMQCRLILNGFVLETRWKESNPAAEGLEIHAYDPALQRYHFHSYDSEGTIIDGFETLTGDVCRGELKVADQKSKTHQVKTTLTFDPHGRTMEVRWEYLENGKWAEVLHIAFTKKG